jgi:hypothetical protein
LIFLEEREKKKREIERENGLPKKRLLEEKCI